MRKLLKVTLTDHKIKTSMKSPQCGIAEKTATSVAENIYTFASAGRRDK
jgi:hypothetical protein